MAMTDEEAAYFRDALDIEEEHDRERIRKEAEELFGEPEFTDALRMLRLHYWTYQAKVRRSSTLKVKRKGTK